MSHPTTPTHHVQLARAENGNIQLSVTPKGTGFPPVAFPAHVSMNDVESAAYAYLRAADVITPDYPYASLVFVTTGHTIVNGKRQPVRTAPLMLPTTPAS